MRQKVIPKIAITGGPCAGKTTALAGLEQKLGDLGFCPIVIPETATKVSLAGIRPGVVPVNVFQRHLLRQGRIDEDYFLESAMHIDSDKVVFLCDRGLPDIGAYTSPQEFELLLAGEGLSLVQARDVRYDAAIFLRSVAYDAPHLYTRENNAARRETVDEARKADERTLAAWVGHPHLRVIDNRGDLVWKKARALEAICRVLGIPAPLEIERKFHVMGFDVSRIPAPVQPVGITQYYLVSEEEGVVERVRARSQGGGQAFYHTMKRLLRQGVREEIERKITQKEYFAFLRRVDPRFGKVEKTRYCFVWKNQYFELDVFHQPHGLMLLEHELTREDEETLMPDFLAGHVRDVSDDPAFTNVEIARRLVRAA
jgi:CYTH domain-containing protein/predicted ATPase